MSEVSYLIQQLSMYKRPNWRHSVDEADMMEGYKNQMEGITREEVQELVKYLSESVFKTTGYAFFPDPAPLKIYWDELKQEKINAEKRIEQRKKEKQEYAIKKANELSQYKVNKAHEKAKEYISSLTGTQRTTAHKVMADMYAERIVDMPMPIKDLRPREVRLKGIRKDLNKRSLELMLGSFITSGEGTKAREAIEEELNKVS